MAKETVQEKGQRLYEAGAVTKVGGGKYRVKGSNGEYTVWDGQCDCPSYSQCSHAVAVELFRAAEREERERLEVQVPVLPEDIRAYAEERGILSWSPGTKDEFGLVETDRLADSAWEDIIEGVRKGEIRVMRTVLLKEGEERLALTATEQVSLF